MGCSTSNVAHVQKAEVVQKPRVEVSYANDFFDHYCLDAKLGQGSFAQVRLIHDLPSGEVDSDENVYKKKPKCAKVLDLRDRRRPGKECPVLQELAAMEVHIAQKVSGHPNVAKLYGAYKHASLGFLVMEKCDCSLSEYMRDLPDINEKILGKLVFQMVSSLHHLHSLKVVHRDVKPDNFLMGGSGHIVKLCDFGLAAILPEHGMLSGPVGTTPFMCPEMIGGFWYDESADIWSLAVTVYVYLYGSFPYASKDGTKEGMKKAILKGRSPTFEPFDKRKEPPSPNACKFVRALLQRSGDLRPSAEEALNFPYMVMVTTGRHMKKASLPSLFPEFRMAHKIGAISSAKLSKRTDMDDFLSILQFKKLGIRMPQAWKALQTQMATSLSEKCDDKGDEDLNLCLEVGLESTMLSTISERSTNCGSPMHSPRKNQSPIGSFKSAGVSLSSHSTTCSLDSQKSGATLVSQISQTSKTSFSL